MGNKLVAPRTCDLLGDNTGACGAAEECDGYVYQALEPAWNAFRLNPGACEDLLGGARQTLDSLDDTVSLCTGRVQQWKRLLAKPLCKRLHRPPSDNALRLPRFVAPAPPPATKVFPPPAMPPVADVLPVLPPLAAPHVAAAPDVVPLMPPLAAPHVAAGKAADKTKKSAAAAETTWLESLVANRRGDSGGRWKPAHTQGDIQVLWLLTEGQADDAQRWHRGADGRCCVVDVVLGNLLLAYHYHPDAGTFHFRLYEDGGPPLRKQRRVSKYSAVYNAARHSFLRYATTRTQEPRYEAAVSAAGREVHRLVYRAVEAVCLRLYANHPRELAFAEVRVPAAARTASVCGMGTELHVQLAGFHEASSPFQAVWTEARALMPRGTTQISLCCESPVPMPLLQPHDMRSPAMSTSFLRLCDLDRLVLRLPIGFADLCRLPAHFPDVAHLDAVVLDTSRGGGRLPEVLEPPAKLACSTETVQSAAIHWRPTLYQRNDNVWAAGCTRHYLAEAGNTLKQLVWSSHLAPATMLSVLRSLLPGKQKPWFRLEDLDVECQGFSVPAEFLADVAELVQTVLPDASRGNLRRVRIASVGTPLLPPDWSPADAQRQLERLASSSYTVRLEEGSPQVLTIAAMDDGKK